MAAKVSAEMRKALRLVARGVPVYEAAAKAKVTASAVYKALKRA